MNNISLLVAIKNNLEYTESFYTTTRNLYPDTEICFASYDSTDGTNEWLEKISLSDFNVKIFYANDKSKSFSDTYNKAVQIATKEYIVFLHNDIILYSSFLENLSKHLTPNNVVSYTTIEHPLFGHHSRPGKIIYDCGDTLTTFNRTKFEQFAKSTIEKDKDKTEPGITFFMALSRKVFLHIDGFDNLFSPFFREDDDLIKRLKMLENISCFTCSDSLCYHFISKTSRFSEEYKDSTEKIENQSIRNYIRKWGSITEDSTYDVSIVAKNCSLESISFLEPFAQNISIDDPYATKLIDEYINKEQLNTKIILKNKLHTDINYLQSNQTTNIVMIDCEKVDPEDIENIKNIQKIIHKINKIGLYKINNLLFKINSLSTIEKQKVGKKYTIEKYLNRVGTQRWDIINYLIKKNQYTRYLEIGVNDGLCIRQIEIPHKDGVDPSPGSEVGGIFVPEINYRMSSDKFFSSIPENQKYDIIFVDGLHNSIQVDKDIINSIKHLNQNGTIIVHDCNPPEYELQLIPRVTGLWNGDVWKSIAKLRCTRPDLTVSVIDTDWGVGVVRPGSQKTYDALKIEEIVNNWEYFDNNRQEILNIISLDQFYELY
jgi:GT2 family glycosyltransferase